LVAAHHSGACFVARARGVDDLLRDYPQEESPLADAVTYAEPGPEPGLVKAVRDLSKRTFSNGHRKPRTTSSSSVFGCHTFHSIGSRRSGTSCEPA
jgi:hypothetical protein